MTSLPPTPTPTPPPYLPPPLVTMKPMDDVWNDISGLPSPTPNHFQNFFSPALRPPVTTTHFLPPPPSTPTMLTLLTTTNSAHEDPNKRPKPNPPPQKFKPATTSPPEYTEKFRRLMKNRESAARSRARKQARADELEQEVMRLAEENANLKRLQKEVSFSQLPKESRLHRTKSAPF